MRSNLKAAFLALCIAAVTAVSLISPATGSVTSRNGFLYDDSNGRLVGIRNVDGSETYFPLYTSQTAADSVAAFSPATPGAIGGTTPAAGSFTTLTASSTLTASGTVTMAPANRSVSIAPTGTGTFTINPATAGTMNNMAIGGSTPLAGAFTTLTASSTATLSPANASVSISPTGTGTVTISPATAGTINKMAIGGTTPAAGAFTTITGTALTAAANSAAVALTLNNQTPSTGKEWTVYSYQDGNLVMGVNNVANYMTLGSDGLKAHGKFGANGATPQAAATLNAASTDATTAVALVNQIRALLIANGLAQ